ncbi:MAG: biopolymer transporter ExbD [Flavobacterium sp.]|nr:MAG: biopolymer transporter ExbD [Flavobacterium sp.]
MAELNTGGGDKKGGKVRSKKSSAGVDLTAMVDLAFLLITFFMLTTSLSKPQSMNLAMPDKEKDPNKEQTMDVPDDRTMTILIGKDSSLLWYLGRFDAPLVPFTKTSYGKDGIRKELLSRVKSVLQTTGDPEKGLIVIIKASDAASYKDLVDILDEMAITKVQLYAIGDITDPEMEQLKTEGLY